jgi:hypothetical protein
MKTLQSFLHIAYLFFFVIMGKVRSNGEFPSITKPRFI